MKRRAANPWLSIPAGDYEAHMGSPAVQQLQYLDSVFADLIARYLPCDLAVLGCATGNGFDRIPSDTRTVIGLDINPEYLKIARARHAEHLPGLQLICADFAGYTPEPRSMDLIYAGLFLEYVDAALVTAQAAVWLRPGGILAVVLQLPSFGANPVTETPYASLRRLEQAMKLVDPDEVRRLAARNGFAELCTRVDTLPTGKQFCVQVLASSSR